MGIVIICVVLAALMATGFFFAKPLGFLGALSHIFSLSSIVDENTALHQENDALVSQLFSLQHGITAASSTSGISADVFSAYPFNTKNRIFIDKGSADGVVVGDGVFASSYVLAGQVVRVAAHESEIMTCFDAGFSLPVRVGNDQVDGLLKGGVTPMVTLIDKSKHIAPGDLIVSASKDFSYGVTIGTVRDVSPDALGAFLQASVQFSYTINDLRHVIIKPALTH